MSRNANWQQDAERELGSSFVQLASVGGGDFAEAFQATLDDGRRVFIKTHRDPPAGFFSTEAAGLSWLREPACIKVPEVLGVSDEHAWLALEWIEVGGRGDIAGESAFGRALATLHQSGAARFGREDGRTTGSLALPNKTFDTWAEFYASCRLRPLARIAADRGVLKASVIKELERVADRLAEFGAADESPSRLHGDLWAGNRVVDRNGDSWILDPAAHAGHREFDLAMMRLFGGYDSAAFDAYNEVHTLTPGWQERVQLHQLAPLVVHAVKFGGGYVRGAADAIRQYA